jgi:aromatic ring-opening dioxygenase catalytic subunit (LigB family)
LLKAANIECTYEQARGFDHGVFIPLKVAYPEADVPIVQVSLLASMDPAQHIRLGQALAPLRDEGILIIGSAPAARDAHPREEHLLPLHVAVGAAGNDPGRRMLKDVVMGAVESAFQFG